MAVVAESRDDRSVVFRTYCSQWPLFGQHQVRAPILGPGSRHPGGVVGQYQAALEAGDADAVMQAFEPDGYFREPAGQPVELGLFEDGRKALVSMLRRNILIGTGLREEYMTHRPHVERAIAQVATWRGRQLKLRYRGTARNHAWLKRRAVALNLRNLLGKGLARRDGAWVLGT